MFYKKQECGAAFATPPPKGQYRRPVRGGLLVLRAVGQGRAVGRVFGPEEAVPAQPPLRAAFCAELRVGRGLGAHHLFCLSACTAFPLPGVGRVISTTLMRHLWSSPF